MVHRAAEDRSDLLILDAQDIAGEPEAVLELPVRVPAGFHGSWVGEAGCRVKQYLTHLQALHWFQRVGGLKLRAWVGYATVGERHE